MGVVLTIVDAILRTSPLLTAVADVAFLLPSLAFGARRLHDVGKSGWYLLAALIPLAGAIYLIYLAIQPGQTQVNQWGPSRFVPPRPY